MNTSNYQPLAENSMELRVAKLLTSGVVLSFLLIALGAGLLLNAKGSAKVDFLILQPGGANFYHPLSQTLQAALKMDPRAIIQTGVFVLVATPVARVLLSVLLFFKKRDYLYVGITLIVFVILITALFSNLMAID